MDDMNAFERQLSAGFKGLMGPSEPVDDAAVFATVTTTRSPRLSPGFAFSAAKYIMAVGILALFGGFLLSGFLFTPEVDEDPAAETESPSPLVTVPPMSFPTGTFVSDEDGLTLEFREDGTCVRAGTPCTFTAAGRYYAEMTFEDPSGLQVPATYQWRFDGDQLTFEPWNDDLRLEREDTYVDQVYRPDGETRPLPAADSEFPTGWFASVDDPDFTILFETNDRWTLGDDTGGGSYAVRGDLLTTTSTQVDLSLHPATFYWDWDGERLTFRPWGVDPGGWWPEFHEAWVRDEAAVKPRTLLLSDVRLEYFVRVEIRELAAESYTAIATVDEEPLGEGTGDTPQAAVRAALEELGEPLASELSEKVPG